MAAIWITYAWADNEEKEIDFVAQELRRAGVIVKLDRWNIEAGKRLWEQIENFIVNPAETDAWLLVATNNSLQSEPCKEEFAYALQRALERRGGDFPVIALFLGPVDQSLIPVAIRTRLFVTITDSDWTERIIAAAEHRSPRMATIEITPYVLKIHQVEDKSVIELRPRAGVWAPFFASVPLDEKDVVDPCIVAGPANVPTKYWHDDKPEGIPEQR